MDLLQENGRGNTDVPMIIGIVGFVATIHGTVCASACSTCTKNVEILTTNTSSGVESFWVIVNLATVVAGLVYGIRSNGTPRSLGAVMLGSATLTLLISFIIVNWIWGLIAVTCFAIIGAISLT